MTLFNNKIKAIISFVLIAAVIVGIVLFTRDNDAENTKNAISFDKAFELCSETGKDYDEYINSFSSVKDINEPITFGEKVIIQKGKSYDFKINTDECMASLNLVFKAQSEDENDAGCKVNINGELPFREANDITLYRQWLSGEASSDKRGNQYSVSLKENEKPVSSNLYDKTGLHIKPLKFHFKSGENIITLTASKCDITVESLSLFTNKTTMPYKEVKKSYPKNTQKVRSIPIEAEYPYVRTNASIVELCDRSSSVTTPTFIDLQLWNSLGGNGWKTTGQYVTWKVNVKQTGVYKLSLRCKQNFTSGISSYRKLLIDGEVPFTEAESISVPYKSGWQVLTLGNDKEDYLFYLTEGEHKITLEATLGEQATALNLASKSLTSLNEIYRDIIMLTGSSPDEYRDYRVEKNLPETIKMLKEQKKVLESLSAWLSKENGGKGEGTAVIDKIVIQINSFIKYPESIPKELKVYQNNITSLSTWIQSRVSQPLTIDKLELTGGETTLKKEAGFFKQLSFSTLQFVRSFAEGYGVIGNVYDNGSAVDAWLTLGRDQYQIIKEHSDNYFTKEKNINVNLKLVAGGLLQAMVAGIAPDVYLFSGEGDPVNYAARGAVEDLTQFSDFNEVVKSFSSEAVIPFRYDKGVYALPISQSFLVMFARDDLLNEIGISVPKTWDDVFGMLTVLQQNHMEFAFPGSGAVSGYAMLLFRNQREFYRNNGKSVAIDTEAAIEAFEEWAKLYTDYSSLMTYDFNNRFRSGDIPIGITDFSTFNSLEVFAPEISGLWSMHPMPGTLREDGTIENVSVSSVSSAIIVKGTKHLNESWEYLKWFTGAEEQYKYATAIENRQGVSGRFATANIKAFNRLAWSADALETINKQRDTAFAIEQVPGGYFLSRHINNIFRAVINEKADVREKVLEYTKYINDEITKKRKEFGLEVDAK